MIRTYILLIFCLTSTFVSGQEVKTADELAAYLPEKNPLDLLEVYNHEFNAASFLPEQRLNDIASLTMTGKVTAGAITRQRKEEYIKAENSLVIMIEGKTSASITRYGLKDGVFTKTMSRIADGKEKPAMKEIKFQDKTGRIVHKENYYNSDTGWVSLSKEDIEFQELKDGLMLEIHKKGDLGFMPPDSIWYFFDKAGVLQKKSDAYNRWNFTYNEKGAIKLIEWTQRDYMSLGETVLHTKYYYNPEGMIMYKETEDKYYNTELRFLYNALGKPVLKTIIKRGDNEVKEANSFTYDKTGFLSAVGQTLDGVTTLKAVVKCDAEGNIISFTGDQFAANSKIQFKNGQGSSGSSVDGPAKINNVITIVKVKP